MWFCELGLELLICGLLVVSLNMLSGKGGGKKGSHLPNAKTTGGTRRKIWQGN